MLELTAVRGADVVLEVAAGTGLVATAIGSVPAESARDFSGRRNCMNQASAIRYRRAL
jgi:hypothetical protein